MFIETAEGRFEEGGWLVSTLGVMVSPLGILLWKVEDFRFLLGPACPAFVGEAGLERLVGVMVADVLPDAYPEAGSWCT